MGVEIRMIEILVQAECGNNENKGKLTSLIIIIKLLTVGCNVANYRSRPTLERNKYIKTKNTILLTPKVIAFALLFFY